MDPDRTIVSFAGTALVDTTCAFGDCNRLRGLPASYLDTAVIAPQESRVVFIDFSFESLDDAPKALLHRITGTGAQSPAFGEPGPIRT